MDADSLFITRGKSLDFIVQDSPQDFIASGDWNTHLNSGHMMIRRSEWSRKVMEDAKGMWPSYPQPEWPDQTALIYVLTDKNPACRDSICAGHDSHCIDHSPECNAVGPGLRSKAKYVPQNVMNSYTSSLGSNDLILHFAGASREEKDSLMRRYAQSSAAAFLADVEAISKQPEAKLIETSQTEGSKVEEIKVEASSSVNPSAIVNNSPNIADVASTEGGVKVNDGSDAATKVADVFAALQPSGVAEIK